MIHVSWLTSFLERSPLDCILVFMVKVNLDKSIARLKTRLIAKGYTRFMVSITLGTFSPVEKLTFVRLLLSLEATYDWSFHQLDIKNVFLHEDLHEVYMDQPPIFLSTTTHGKECRLMD